MKERIYGSWAGNPKGTPEDPTRCIESVHSGFRFYQCQRKRGHGPDGLYCKQHDPEEIKRKQSIAARKWDEKQAAWKQEFNDHIVGARLRKSNPDLYAKLLKNE